MAVVTIDPGQAIKKDPSDIIMVLFDWDAANLAASAAISTSTMTVAAYRPASATVPTLDQESIVGSSRKTQVRVTGGTAGATYKLTNQIVTNESPAQTKNRHVFIHVEDL